MSKQKKEDDEKAYDMGGEARKLSDITLLLQHPLSHGICAPVFDKIAIVTASDDLPTLQRRQKQAQTEAYSAVLDKATVVGCLKEVNDYVSRANLPYDDDDTDRIVISMKLKGDDWISSVMALDVAEPWRNCWMEQLHRHPFNTIFLPCNLTVCIFVPHGQTLQSVGSRIKIDDCVAPREVAAGWDRDWNRPPVAHKASQGAASGTSSAVASTTSTRDTLQASSLDLLASAAATSTSTGAPPISAGTVSTTTEI
ncbi:hypothetical protein PC110_g17358 [Phytophthora cactorum]|uniref:Uncharacterized protein n=1 Tax=Phytophthora cactorum TaxID=29920 RepID=A0A329RPG8_9STRA|nr:hypothetical protein PC110_g17358 [Phytophthora cactorum]